MVLASLSFRSVVRCVVLILAILTLAARAQVTPSGTQTKNGDPTTNCGGNALLNDCS